MRFPHVVHGRVVGSRINAMLLRVSSNDEPIHIQVRVLRGAYFLAVAPPPRLSFPLQAPIIYQVLYYKHTTHVTIVVVALSTSLPSHAAWKGCQVARPGGLEGIANHQHTRTMSAFWSLLKPSCSVWSSSSVRSTPASASDTFSFGKETFCNCEG